MIVGGYYLRPEQAGIDKSKYSFVQIGDSFCERCAANMVTQNMHVPFKSIMLRPKPHVELLRQELRCLENNLIDIVRHVGIIDVFVNNVKAPDHPPPLKVDGSFEFK